jgi:dTDP-4-amino-4,6-dideoxygalactose transaminase
MINIFQPVVASDSLGMVADVFKSNWLGRGKLVTEFECKLSKFLKVDRETIVTMSCCSDAIFGILPIIKRRFKSRQVLVPSISFPAVGSSVVEAGLDLVIIDVECNTGNISLDAVREHMNEDVLAVFLTHYGGNPVDVLALREIVGPNVFILEDSACALGSVLESGVSVGMHGDFSCWSFDAMKLLVAGEGGGAWIPKEEIRTEFKESLYLGLPASGKSGLDKSGDSAEWWSYDLKCFGRRSIFTDINAAIALPQFKTLSEKLRRRQFIREQYSNSIDQNSNLHVTPQNGCSIYSNYFFTILSENRNHLAFYLKDNNVYSTFRYFPLNQIRLFNDIAVVTNMDGSNSFSSKALNIPIHDGLSETDIKYICKLLIDYKQER